MTKFRYLLIVFLLNFFLTNFIFVKKSLAATCAYTYPSLSGNSSGSTLVEGNNDHTVCINNPNLDTFTNSGIIENINGIDSSATGGKVIQIETGGIAGSSLTINNSGTLVSQKNHAIEINGRGTGSSLTINNSGSISGLDGFGITGFVETFKINNTGTITGKKGGVSNRGGGIWIDQNAYIYNSGTIGDGNSSDNTDAILNWNLTTNTAYIFNNTSGIIQGKQNGINNDGGGVNSIINLGKITGTSGKGITNSGTLTNLVNRQGSNDGTIPALTYTGTLPTNYYLYISSLNNYGQLSIII